MDSLKFLEHFIIVINRHVKLRLIKDGWKIGYFSEF